MPYLTTNVLLAAASLFAETWTRAAGYVFLCLLGSTTYTVVGLLVPLLHAGASARAAGVRLRTAVDRTVAVPLVAAVLAAVPVAIAIARYPAYASAVFRW
jgi:hypothetical protein